MKVMKYLYINPCLACEHGHGYACPDCPIKQQDMEQQVEHSRYYEGKLVIASGEDAHAFA